MGADLGPLFEDTDGDILTGFSRELLQPDRGGKARRPRTHDDDVIFHGFALDVFHSLSSPKFQPSSLGRMILSENRFPLFRIMRSQNRSSFFA
jgi:hypothetical protein